MAIKRRGFLGMLGATVSAPFLPASAAGAVSGGIAKQAAPYSAAALHGAIFHAKSRAVFSVWGLARAVNLSVDQAEALMGDLAKRGVVGPLQGTTHGGRWASSKIMDSQVMAMSRAARAPRPDASDTGSGSRAGSRSGPAAQVAEPDLSALLAHLRGLAARHFSGRVPAVSPALHSGVV